MRPDLFWEVRIEIKGHVDALISEGGRQKFREKLADYTRQFLLAWKGINDVGNAADDLPLMRRGGLNVESDANHAGSEAQAGPAEQGGNKPQNA